MGLDGILEEGVGNGPAGPGPRLSADEGSAIGPSGPPTRA